MTFSPLTPDFFAGNPMEVAPRLLGALLVRETANGVMAARLVELEAYPGAGDRGSHCWNGPTPRTTVMFARPGLAYAYFIYGNYWMLNVVCWPEGQGGAVLLRGAEPVLGEDLLVRQRLRARAAKLPTTKRPAARTRWLLAGPARLASAFGVSAADNGMSLTDPPFYLAQGSAPAPEDVRVSRRIGLSAGRGEALLGRFYIAGSPGVSPQAP